VERKDKASFFMERTFVYGMIKSHFFISVPNEIFQQVLLFRLPANLFSKPISENFTIVCIYPVWKKR
jgi:hypothetical protein